MPTVSPSYTSWLTASLADKSVENARLNLAAIEAAISPMREVLAANRTYYVRTDGSDSNTGLANTSGGAFLTIQKAIDVAAALDINTRNVTVSVGSGTFGGFTVTGPWIGSGSVTVTGAGAASTTISASICVKATQGGRVTVGSMKYVASSRCLNALYNGVITLGSGSEFGTTTSEQIIAENGGAVDCNFQNYTISGSARTHITVDTGGFVRSRFATVTLTGTPAFSTAFFEGYLTGTALLDNNTFSGSATGSRYTVNANAAAYVAGAGASYLPGNAAGSTATGGQYI